MRALLTNLNVLILMSVILPIHTAFGQQFIDKPGLWQSFGPHQAQLRIDAIIPDSTNPGVIYTSSGGFLHKSTKYGLQWQLLTAPVADRSAQLALIADDRVFVTTLESIFYSDHGGASWTEAEGPIRGKRGIRLKKIDNTLYAATFSDGVFFSTDAGANWTQANPPMHNQFAGEVVKSGNSLYVNTNSGIWVSTNGGLDWVQTNSPPGGQGVSYLFANDNALIASVTNESLFRSVDGGETWSEVQPLVSPFILEIKELNGRLYAWGFDADRSIRSSQFFTSTDGGASWTNITSNIGSVGVTKLISVDGTLVAGTNFSGVFVSENNGVSWTKVDFPVQENSNGLEISALVSAEGTLYAAAFDRGVFSISLDQAGVFISTDNGKHWRKSITGLSDKIDIDDLIVDINYIVAGRWGGGGSIFQSADLGLNWVETIRPESQFFPQNIWNINGTVFVSSDAGGGGDIRLSKDGGISWTQGSLSVRELISVNGILYGTFQTGLYKSHDNGITWTAIDVQSGNGVSVLVGTLFADNDVIYIGTSVGVFQSVDDGINWQQVDGSTLDRSISTIIKAEGVLYAGTNNAGVFKKTDQGWIQANPPVNSTRVLKIVPSAGNLFINTTSGIYFSHDGLNWTNSNFPPTGQQVNSLQAVGGRVFAGTNNGVFWTENGTDWFSLNTGWRDVRVNKIAHLPVFGRLYAATDDGVYLQDIDITPPKADSLIINNQAQFSDSLQVNLILIADADADSMAVSEDRDFKGVAWEPQNVFRSFTLSNNDGVKTIYAKFKDISFNQSAVLSAQIILDQTDPNFAPFPHQQPANANPNTLITINQQVQENNLASMILRFRRFGETFNNSSRAVSFANNTAVIDGAWVQNKGIDYQIIATDRAGRSTIRKNGALDFFSLPVDLEPSALGNSPSLPSGAGSTAYRMVSIPLDLPNAPQVKNVFSNLGQYGRRGKWRFYSYQGNGQWQEGENLPMQTGAGHFIIRRDGGNLTNAISGPTAKTTDGVLGNISGWQLRAGDWTAIGNPYNTKLALSQLSLKSNRALRLSDPNSAAQIWGYDGRWKNARTEDLELETWGGLFVRVSKIDTIVFANTAEPYSQSLGKTNTTANPLENLNADEWWIQITAASGEFTDDANYLGVKKEAQDELDNLDWYEPPFLPDGVGLSFPHAEWNDRAELTADFRAVSGEGHRWEIAVKGEPTSAVQISFGNLETVPSEYQILLVDETTKIVRDLRKESQLAVRIPAKVKSRALTVLVGNEFFINKNTAGRLGVPTIFALHQNYPNPFNPSTTIRYQLPVAGRVTLKIFDIMGREAMTLEENKTREPGYYEMVVDMSALRSGVYFYRIAIAGEQKFQATQKMLYVK